MKQKEKLLFIVEAMGGGVFTYIVELANELVNTYDMYVAYATRKQTPSDYKNYFDKRVKLIEVKNFKRSLDASKDLKSFFEIQKIAKEINPDIIHLHSSKAGALGRFAFNGKRVPVFYTPHGYSFLMKDQSSLKRNIYKFIEVICSKRKCTTISCSKGEHEETLKLTSRAIYINNGINISELQNLIDSIDIDRKSSFTVFTLGRICYQKNPIVFNEIALQLPNIKFMWIGDGEMREVLTAPNIEITGWCKREEALKYALTADVFLLTSLWEGLPMSLLESMYMKKLCVVSNVIGNRDVIQNNKNGFVCNEVKDFVKAIKLAKQGQVDRLIDNAYKEMLEQYNTTYMASQYSDVYKKELKIS